MDIFNVPVQYAKFPRFRYLYRNNRKSIYTLSETDYLQYTVIQHLALIKG